MPNKIKPKRSFTPNSVPLTTDLTEVGELAINWADGIAYTRNSAGQIVSVTLGGGGGGGSGEDTALRAFFVPPAPTSVTATAGNAQAVVSWTAPTVLSQTPITDYVVQYQPSGGAWTTFSDGTSIATSATVTGLTNGTAYQFRVAAVNGVGTGAYSTASSAVTPVAGDPLWGSVQLLLPGDTSVADASSYSRSVTAYGNAGVSTSVKRWGAGSLAFDGSGDYLTVSGLSLGTSSFAIEFWFQANAVATYAQLIGNETSGSAQGFSLLINNDGAGQVALYGPSGLYLASSSGDWSDGQWHHVAVARTGSDMALYIDGTRHSTASYSGSLTSSSDYYIGRNNVYANRDFTGYIDDLRITVNSDRGYTGATIPVPASNFPNS